MLYAYELEPKNGADLVGATYLLFAKLPRIRVGLTDADYKVVFQLYGCLELGVAVLAFENKDPLTTRFDLCELEKALRKRKTGPVHAGPRATTKPE